MITASWGLCRRFNIEVAVKLAKSGKACYGFEEEKGKGRR